VLCFLSAFALPAAGVLFAFGVSVLYDTIPYSPSDLVTTEVLPSQVVASENLYIFASFFLRGDQSSSVAKKKDKP